MEFTLANDIQLKKVTDEHIILSLLSGAKDSRSEVFVWKLIGNQKHLGLARIESIRKIRKDFCLTPLEGQESLIQDLMGCQDLVDLYIPSSSTLLRCIIKQADAPDRYHLQLPEFIAQVERRDNLRMEIDGNSEVKLSFTKSIILPRKMSQRFTKNCFNISTGGFSFYISKMETNYFQMKDLISSVEVSADKWSTKVESEIVAIKEIEPDENNGLSYKVWHVSCRFSKIDPISQKYLENYILERIKKELHAISK